MGPIGPPAVLESLLLGNVMRSLAAVSQAFAVFVPTSFRSSEYAVSGAFNGNHEIRCCPVRRVVL